MPRRATGSSSQCKRNGEAECPSCLDIDHEAELGWRLHLQLTRAGAQPTKPCRTLQNNWSPRCLQKLLLL
jgi:hypothetical protein